jgi:hypothetical protein
MLNARLWMIACVLCSCMSTGGAETLIGAPCNSAEDCDVTGVCITDGLDGLCSRRCRVPGGAGECPLGSYCDSAELTTDVQSTSEMTLCLPACKAQKDCRDGYVCVGVSGGPGKVCRPG